MTSPIISGVGITPYAAAQFVTFDLPSYAENAIAGSNAFALSYGAKDVTDPRSELGIRTDKSWLLTDGLLVFRTRFAWAHDYDPSRSIAATFQTLPGSSFVVNGAAQSSELRAHFGLDRDEVAQRLVTCRHVRGRVLRRHQLLRWQRRCAVSMVSARSAAGRQARFSSRESSALQFAGMQALALLFQT